MKPGIYTDLSNADYHAGPGLSRSKLWTTFNKSPAHAMAEKVAQTKAMLIGSVVHVATLEPDLFERDYVRSEKFDKRTNIGKLAAEQFADQNQGKEIVEADVYDLAASIRDSLHGSAIVRDLLKGGKAEHSAYWEDFETGELCRVRPDMAQPGYILDLKTTQDASPDSFAKSVAGFGYHLQDAYYSEGWTQAGGGKIDRFIFLAVEKEPPYAWAIYELDDAARAEGQAIMRYALDSFHECRKANRFPSYPETVASLALPPWAFKLTAPKGAFSF
jgi:exodeoxyribonuclease VIII